MQPLCVVEDFCAFLQNQVEENDIILSGCIPGFKSNDIRVLSLSKSKVSVKWVYTSTCKVSNKKAVSYKKFIAEPCSLKDVGRSPIGITGNQRKPMNSFCHGNHGQRYCSWARTHDNDGYDGVAQHGGHGSAPSIADLMKFLQRTSVKEKSREQELTGTEVARKIAKESGRGLKKGGENDTEQCESRRK